ncbi:MAG: GTP cyclohydrolase II [Kofleriaceae bacterium]
MLSAGSDERVIQICAEAEIPTGYGLFRFVVFRWSEDVKNSLSPDHVALIHGKVIGQDGVLVRVHSECMTSEVFGSLKCDCREQLQIAQQQVVRAGAGVILYLRQEGRGIGLANKIRAYHLQHQGHDTVDANRMLGLPDDDRDYSGAAAMLRHLGISSIRLITNNPLKIDELRQHGIVVSETASLVRPNQFSAPYLAAKRERMGHHLPSLSPPPPAVDGDATSEREFEPESQARQSWEQRDAET